MKVVLVFSFLIFLLVPLHLKAQDELDETLDSTQGESEELLKEAERVMKEKSPIELLKLAKKLGAGEPDKKNPKIIVNPYKGEFSAAIYDTLRPFKDMTEEQLEKFLSEKFSNPPAANLLKAHPKGYLFFARVLRDEKAVPEMVRIAEDRERLYWYIGANIATIILGIVLKRIGREKAVTFFSKMKRFLFRFTFNNLLRIGIFIYFFHAEFAPISQIFKATFFP